MSCYFWINNYVEHYIKENRSFSPFLFLTDIYLKRNSNWRISASKVQAALTVRFYIFFVLSVETNFQFHFAFLIVYKISVLTFIYLSAPNFWITISFVSFSLHFQRLLIRQLVLTLSYLSSEFCWPILRSQIVGSLISVSLFPIFIFL